MGYLRLSRLLLGLALLAWIGTSAASKCICSLEDLDQKGFYRERPKCECGNDYYRSCTNRAYYAYSPTMCIYVSQQEFTHEEAEKFCAERDSAGFLAFVEHWDESYHVAHFVWNVLKEGVEGDETYFWTSGKFGNSERNKQKSWLYEYRGYYADVPAALFSDESRAAAKKEGKHCLSGHTRDYDNLYAKDCSEKLPAVCYYYRETTAFYCPAVNDASWTLFRGKCYYRYSAPFGIKGSSAEDLEKHYKTWFEAREECAKLGAKLASVHDQATHEKLLQLIAGNENVTTLQETTWIGLQVGAPENVPIPNQYGKVLRYEYQTGCYWPAGVRPRIALDDPDPKNAVGKCSITYDDIFHGQWEDGKRYNEAESVNFWGPDEPSDLDQESCDGRKPFTVDEQSRAYCERGVNGHPEQRPHCALVLPPDEKQIEREFVKPFAGKWAAFWCWMKNRGYICESPAKRTGGHNEL